MSIFLVGVWQPAELISMLLFIVGIWQLYVEHPEGGRNSFLAIVIYRAGSKIFSLEGKNIGSASLLPFLRLS
jgi:hypothetical protein